MNGDGKLTQSDTLTETDDDSTCDEHSELSSGGKALDESRNDGQQATDSHTISSSQSIGLQVRVSWAQLLSTCEKTYDRTSEEETSENGTDVVGTVDETESVSSGSVEICYPVLRVLAGVENRCIVAVEDHACCCHERDIPEVNEHQLSFKLLS